MKDAFVVPAVVAGFAFVSIWVIYRLFQGLKYRQYRREHAKEWFVRSNFDRDHDLPFEERRRRAEWDSRYGPLLGGLDLRNREEGRWPVSAAFQGAAAVAGTVLIGMLIWNGRISHQAPREGQTTYTYVGTPYGDESGEKRGDSRGAELLGTIFLCCGLIAGGVFLLRQPASKAAAGAGIGLLTLGSVTATAKLLSIDKMWSTDAIVKINHTSGKSSSEQQAPATTFIMRLPPFATGTAVPDSQIRCAAETLGSALKNDPGIVSIVVVGRADRRNVRNNAHKLYASNWGLAQQRAEGVAASLVSQGVGSRRVSTAVAGPVLTAIEPTENALAADRAVSVTVHAVGAIHEWTDKITSGGEWRGCSPTS